MPENWRSIIADINSTGEEYLLAVSGGVDSMFMLAFFAKNCSVPFRVAHFNHGLRPAADAEERFVGDWCLRNGIGFISARGDARAMLTAPSMEAEARRQRYKFLDESRSEREMLVTAHHANDQLETVLLRLMRGYPDNNLRMRRVSGVRYKPFLSVSKEEIVRQAACRRVPWIEDGSNADNSIERNWVRNVLVPQMMERRNVLRTIALRREEDEPCFRERASSALIVDNEGCACEIDDVPASGNPGGL